MSAVNSSSGDRDGEALRRAQRAHEPSMEEILASIRNMMVDEREAEKAAPSRSASPRSAAPAPQIVYSKENSAPQRAAAESLVRTDPPSASDMKPLPDNKPAAESKPSPGGKSASAKHLGDAGAAIVVRPHPEPADFSSPIGDEPLLSQEASQTVTSAFEALSAKSCGARRRDR